MIPSNREEWLRWSVQTGLAIATNVVIVSWWLSATVADMRAKVGEHDRMLQRMEVNIQQVQQVNVDQAVDQGRMAVDVVNLKESLEAINKKLDILLAQKRGGN